MRTASQLPHEELVEIVHWLQQRLYLVHSDEGQPLWDTDKPWSGADILGELAALLNDHGLVPRAVIPFTETR